MGIAPKKNLILILKLCQHVEMIVEEFREFIVGSLACLPCKFFENTCNAEHRTIECVSFFKNTSEI